MSDNKTEIKAFGIIGELEGEPIHYKESTKFDQPPRRNGGVALELSAGRCGALRAAGTTRNSSRLAVNLTTTIWASYSKSPPVAFSTRRLSRKPPGTTRQLLHPILSPGGPGYDRGRLTSVPGPEAGNHDSPNALLLPHLPRAPRGRGDYQPGRPGPPYGPDAGLGTMPHHPDRRGQLDPQAARLRHEPLG